MPENFRRLNNGDDGVFLMTVSQPASGGATSCLARAKAVAAIKGKENSIARNAKSIIRGVLGVAK